MTRANCSVTIRVSDNRDWKLANEHSVKRASGTGLDGGPANQGGSMPQSTSETPSTHLGKQPGASAEDALRTLESSANELAERGPCEPSMVSQGAARAGTTRIRPRRAGDDASLDLEMTRVTPAQAAASLNSSSLSAVPNQDSTFIQWRWDVSEARFSDVSHEALTLGYPLEQWCQPGFYESILHADDRETVLQRRVEHLEARLPFRSQYRVLDARQDTVWLEEILFVEADAQNGLSVHGIFIDSTKRQQAMERLRQSESLHRSMFECLGNGFVVQDLNDVIIQCNSAAARILGLRPQDLIGRSSRDPAWKGQLEDGTWIDSSQHPTVVTLKTGQPQRDVVFSVERADGKRIWLRVNSEPVLNQDGSMRAVMAEFADITREVLTKTSLRSAKQLALLKREQLDLTLDAANIGIWIWQPHRDSFSCDERCQTVLNLPCQTTPHAHRDWLSQVHPNDRGSLERMLNEMRTGSAVERDCTYRIVLDDNQWRWVQTTGRVLSAEPGRSELSISGIVQDVTSTKLRELELARLRDEADRANHAKSVFLANVSHEVRTPLTAILGYTEMLRFDRELWNDVEATDRALQTVENAGKHLLSVINDILDLTKIEAGHSTIEITKTNPLQILLEVESLLRPRAEGKGVRYETRLQSSIPPQIFSDATRLKQVLLNLVGNAVKFTSTGAVQVVVGQTGHEASRWLQIDIVDSGPGIDESDQERIFASFIQADSSMNRQHGGTGLGLTISRRLMEALGGSVELIESQRGIGSTFRIRLPIRADEAGDLSNARASLDELTCETPSTRREQTCEPETCTLSLRSSASRAGMESILSGRILVVDDGPDNLNLISYILRREGADVTTAASGEEALRLFQEAALSESTAFDLVVTDIQMPGMNGLELTQRIRLEAEEIPIIALTAHAMRDAAESCLSAGCSDFVPKPIDRSAFVASCRRWLNQAAGR